MFAPETTLAEQGLRPLSLWSLLGCDGVTEPDHRLRLRLIFGGSWQMAFSPLRYYPRLQPIEAIAGECLELQALDRIDPAARVETLDLELIWQDQAGPIGSGWLTLSYKAPLWIEHLLRDLPLQLLASGKSEGHGSFGLCVGDILLREVVLPQECGQERLVSCRFDLVSPGIAAFDLEDRDGAFSQ